MVVTRRGYIPVVLLIAAPMASVIRGSAIRSRVTLRTRRAFDIRTKTIDDLPISPTGHSPRSTIRSDPP